jgi:hypothetical protein
MFQFPWYASYQPMYSAGSNCPLRQLGFPIRKSPDQCLLTAPRGGIVVRHVLLRLLVPRHPPCALTSLTICSGDSACASLQSKKRSNLEHLSLIIKTAKGCFSNSFLSLSSFQGANNKVLYSTRLATSYSPKTLRSKYHWRWRA